MIFRILIGSLDTKDLDFRRGLYEASIDYVYHDKALWKSFEIRLVTATNRLRKSVRERVRERVSE